MENCINFEQRNLCLNFNFLSTGSGRVTFSSKKSYMKAVQAAFIEIKTPKFTKKVSSLHQGKTSGLHLVY